MDWTGPLRLLVGVLDEPVLLGLGDPFLRGSASVLRMY